MQDLIGNPFKNQIIPMGPACIFNSVRQLLPCSCALYGAINECKRADHTLALRPGLRYTQNIVDVTLMVEEELQCYAVCLVAENKAGHDWECDCRTSRRLTQSTTRT